MIDLPTKFNMRHGKWTNRKDINIICWFMCFVVSIVACAHSGGSFALYHTQINCLQLSHFSAVPSTCRRNFLWFIKCTISYQTGNLHPNTDRWLFQVFICLFLIAQCERGVVLKTDVKKLNYVHTQFAMNESPTDGAIDLYRHFCVHVLGGGQYQVHRRTYE